MSEDTYTVDDAAAAATRMLRHGVPDTEIKDLLPDEMQQEAWTLARLRKKASQRFQDPWELFFTEQTLRYATPDTIANARAQRLKDHGTTAIDVACGAGIQLAYLAHHFDHATGIELDPDTARLARKNLDALDADARIVTGDALDETLQDEIGPADVIFCDPARAPEAPQRDLDSLSPDIRRIHEAWSQDANAYCYELPPMMDPQRVHDALPGEHEYTSLNGDLNRFALYGGTAEQAHRSALALPANQRLTDHDPATQTHPADDPHAYLHLVDRAILQARLLEQLAHAANAPHLLTDEHPRRTLLTSDEPARTAFTDDYEVLDQHDWNLLGLHEKLKRLDAGKVTLRASLDPDRYWDVRNALEDGLQGDQHVHLFRIHDQGIITRPLGTDDAQAPA